MTAGDGRFTGVIPPSSLFGASYEPGEMLRYAVTATSVSADGVVAGATAREPPFLDPSNSPEYLGTVVRDAAVDSSLLPVFHWFVEDVDRTETRLGTRASIFFRGEFYDNVFNRVRGGTATRWSKMPFKFDFNRGDHFRLMPEVPRVEEVNLNTTAQDKAYVREPLSYETFRLAGVPASLSFNVRVEQNGEFFSVAMLTEQVDDRFLERNGLDPEGALYKMINNRIDGTGGTEKKTRRSDG